MKTLPLHLHQSHPEYVNIQVKLDGAVVHNFIEVDVLGCVGVCFAFDDDGEIMLDDDGIIRRETVYGRFELEWCEDEFNLLGGFTMKNSEPSGLY